MKFINSRVCTALALIVAVSAPLCARSADLSDDRLSFSGNGSSLTGTSGGGGASAGWIHNFDPDTLVGIAANYQALAVSHWTFGSITGAMTRGAGDQRYTVYGGADEGAGRDGPNAFKYHIETLGLTGTYFHRLSATLEDKQVNVETTHGNLPKFQLGYFWNPRLQTTVGYQHSIGGNLGTRLTTARIDVYAHDVSFLAGGAIGQASPSVLGVLLTLPPRDLKEGYVGVVKSFPHLRSDLTLTVDYQRLSGGSGTFTDANGVHVVPVAVSQRWTGTLNYVVHIGHHGT